MYCPEWGQTPWSSTLRQTRQRTPYNAWGAPSPMYAKTPYYERTREPTPTEEAAAAASERLYANRRHYSDSTKRWRSGEKCRRPRSAKSRPRKPSRAAPAAPARDAPVSSRPMSREAPDAPEVWASNVTRRPRPASAPAVVADAPQLGKQKMRDYGYGVPQWSPYYRPAGYAPEAAARPSSRDYGHFPASQSLSPALQMRSARANIKEMKGRATVDHLWETMGSRPKCVNDLHWIEVAREQAALEEAHHRKLAGETA